MKEAPEFSRTVPLARLGAERFTQRIEAGPAERAALAQRFDLVALDRLAATVELHRRTGELIELHAAYEAEFVQHCVVTLDPVPGTTAGEFTLLYGPPEAEAAAAAGNAGDDVAFEPLDGAAIDIGEAVAQEFSLALPPFPRLAEAGVEPPDDAPAAAGPFAELARLIERREE